MFKAYVEALTAYGGTPWYHPALMQKHWDLLLAARMFVETQMSADREVKVAKKLEAEARKIADDEFLACLFIRMADSKRYWELKLKLYNTFLFGGDDYPKNLTEDLALLKNFNPSKKTGSNEKGTIEDEQVTGQHTVFAHVQAEVPKKKQQYGQSNVECFACGNKRHTYWNCSNVSPKMKEMIIERDKRIWPRRMRLVLQI